MRKVAGPYRRELHGYWELLDGTGHFENISTSSFQRAAGRLQSRSRSLYLNKNVRIKYRQWSGKMTVRSSYGSQLEIWNHLPETNLRKQDLRAPGRILVTSKKFFSRGGVAEVTLSTSFQWNVGGLGILNFHHAYPGNLFNLERTFTSNTGRFGSIWWYFGLFAVKYTLY